MVICILEIRDFARTSDTLDERLSLDFGLPGGGINLLLSKTSESCLLFQSGTYEIRSTFMEIVVT